MKKPKTALISEKNAPNQGAQCCKLLIFNYFANLAKSCKIVENVLIFFLVPHEVFLGGVVRPDVFDGFVDFAVVFKFFEVLDDFVRGAGARCVVDEFVFGCGPRSLIEPR